MIFPQLVHRAKELGASPSEIGLFGSIYGTLQFFCSPIMVSVTTKCYIIIRLEEKAQKY